MTILRNESVNMASKIIFSLPKRIQEATWKLQRASKRQLGSSKISQQGSKSEPRGGGATPTRQERSEPGLWGRVGKG